MLIFPEPQICEWSDSTVRITGGVDVRVPEGAGELARYAASVVRGALGADGGAAVIMGTAADAVPEVDGLLTRLEGVPNADQGYVLSINRDRIVLAGFTETGVLYAAQTLAQMVQGDAGDASLRAGVIVDWPRRKYRGIFAESRWCSELMTLQDWKDAIDVLAGLKFNVLDVGIANNWMIQYEGKRSEFLLVPIRKYPQLRAPQQIEYYSAVKGENVRLEYLPRMFEEDFFGDIVAYGASRGITVYPHFNTPGHNTLIPRKIPEISSKDEQGNPVGYGFCLSNPATYQVMFDILDEIVDRYLLPHGVRFFHLGLDEVWPILGMDESEPSRVVSPFCRCPDCAGKDWYDQFVDYTVALCRHLADKGIEKIGMWHDSFARGGRMNEELVQRFSREGLRDKVVLHWWQYDGFFDTIHPELGVASWVVPMTGYYYWTPLSNHLDNIYLAAQKGEQENAEGAESYTVYYNAYYHNYACLAEYSWNPNVGDVDAFKEKYRRFMMGDSDQGRAAFERFEFITEDMAPTSSAIYHYTYSYAMNRRAAFIRGNYPQAIVEQLWDNPGGIWNNLEMIHSRARQAGEMFADPALWRRNPASLNRAYAAEMARTAASAGLFLSMAKAVRVYRDMQADADFRLDPLADSISNLEAALAEMDGAIKSIETDLPAYMGPSMIRELTMQRELACSLIRELSSRAAAAVDDGAAALVDLECMKTQPVRWVGKAQ